MFNQYGKGFTVNENIHVVALVKGKERFVFLFDENKHEEALRTFGRYASNPQLSFTWYDAAILGKRIRRIIERKEGQTANSSASRLSFTSSEDDLF
ncbi:MAG: hypothetical protein MPJ24_03665 [Pirellulaceae bacterium]|nr:hypothetical protein [Pirellulaceae bacterium]